MDAIRDMTSREFSALLSQRPWDIVVNMSLRISRLSQTMS